MSPVDVAFVGSAFFFVGAILGARAEAAVGSINLKVERLRARAWFSDVARRLRRTPAPLDVADSLSDPEIAKDLARLVDRFVSLLEEGAHLPGRHDEHTPYDPDCPCRDSLEEAACALRGCGFCRYDS